MVDTPEEFEFFRVRENGLTKTAEDDGVTPRMTSEYSLLPEIHCHNKNEDRQLYGFTPKELRKLRSMKNPYGIQKFLDDMPYHLEDTAWSPRKVLAEESSHCLEGAIFGAAALRANGYPPLLLDFEAEHDTDHVISIFRAGRLLGRGGEVQLHGMPLAGTGLSQLARTGAELFQRLLQPAA